MSYATAAYQRARARLIGQPCALRCSPTCRGIADTADHIVPLSAGGTNDAHNLQPACGPCNSSKGNGRSRRRNNRAPRRWVAS